MSDGEAAAMWNGQSVMDPTCVRCGGKGARGGWYYSAAKDGRGLVCTPCRVYEVTQVERAAAILDFIEDALNGGFDPDDDGGGKAA